MNPTLTPLDLTCPKCSARYKLVPKGERLPSGLTCPRCRGRIEVPSWSPPPPPQPPPMFVELPEAFDLPDVLDLPDLSSIDDNVTSQAFGELSLDGPTSLDEVEVEDVPPPKRPPAPGADRGGPDLMALLGDRQNFESPPVAPEDLLGEPLRTEALGPGGVIDDSFEFQLIPIDPRLPRRSFPMAQPPEAGTRRTVSTRTLWLTALLLTLILAGLLSGLTPFGLFGARPLGVARGQGLGELEEGTLTRVAQALPGAMSEEATAQARARVHAALEPAPDTAPGVIRLAQALHEDDPHRAYALLDVGLRHQLPAASLAQARLELMILEGRSQDAQRFGWEALDHHPQNADLWAALAQAYAQDPQFHPPLPRVLRVGRDLETLRGAAGDALQGARGDRPVGSFTPTLRRQQSQPRAQQAASHLCALLDCPLASPVARAARLEISDVDALADVGEALWRAEAVIDLQGRTAWLSGAWTPTPVRDAVNFPIEEVSLWGGWLSQATPAEALAQPADEALQAQEATGEGQARRLKALAPALQGHDLAWLAQQLSHAIVQDFLINAWWRFAESPEDYGANTGLSPEGIVLRGERPVMTSGQDEVMQARLQRVERFSRRAILRLRHLRPEQTRALLFPPQGTRPGEEAHFEVFWKRRERLLAHVDVLIARYGEERVLCFE